MTVADRDQPAAEVAAPAEARKERLPARLLTLMGKRKEYLAAVLVSVVVTFVTVQGTYDGFFGEALGTFSALLLFLVNAAFTIALVAAMTKVFQPGRPVVYAIVVALAFQALIATDLEVEPLAGTTEVGAPNKLNLGAIYDPIEKLLSDGMEDPVEDAKRSEIQQLRAIYPAEANLPTMRSDFEEVLATEEIDDKERSTVLEQIDGVLAREGVAAATKVRDVALAVYAAAGRDPVEDLLASK